MSRLYDALRRAEQEQRPADVAPADPAKPVELLNLASAEQLVLPMGRSAKINAPETSRLVSLTDSRSLGAEKFRSLAARLENLRRDKALKSLQITSGLVDEGKSLVSANLALTFALEFSARVLLVEGDLHRPALATRFGLNELTGLTQWWDSRNQEVAKYIHRLDDLPLWFLAAGGAAQRPSQILQSARLAEAFPSLNGWFDWIIVDSTPMSPTVDANLWSRLVDGTLLVVREGVASKKALKQGLQALDHPNVVGIVFNEASDVVAKDYQDQYSAFKQTITK